MTRSATSIAKVQRVTALSRRGTACNTQSVVANTTSFLRKKFSDNLEKNKFFLLLTWSASEPYVACNTSCLANALPKSVVGVGPRITTLLSLAIIQTFRHSRDAWLIVVANAMGTVPDDTERNVTTNTGFLG